MKNERERRRVGREELEEGSGLEWNRSISGRTQKRTWLKRKKDLVMWEYVGDIGQHIETGPGARAET